MTALSVIILTYNEERHIARAIESIAAITADVVVVDSFSTDRTVEIARALGARVLQNPFVNQSRQFQWALDTLPISGDWIMRLDADEVIGAELAGEITEKLPRLGPQVAGINLKRRHIFLGRWIRHGGRYPLVLTRIFRKGQGRVEDRWMDEHIIASGGSTVTFDHPFADHNLHDLGTFTAKHNHYATREAVDVLGQRYGLFAEDRGLAPVSSSRQAAIKRFAKQRLYNRIPFPVSPLAYFLFRYVIRLGFLDGREGLIYHVLQGFWYRFLVGAKTLEFDRAIRPLPSREDRRKALARLTGLPL